LKSLALYIEPEIEPEVSDLERAGEREIGRYRSLNRPKHWRISRSISGPNDIGPGPIPLEEIGAPIWAIYDWKKKNNNN
jgi:hypothetical protein